MNLHEFLRTRRSVRRFEPTPVDEATVRRLIETAAYAPSAHNRQPWRFAVLTQPEPKSRLAERMAADFRHDLAADGLPAEEIERLLERSRSRIVESPLVIVLCMDASEMDVYPDPKRQQAERMMAIQSTALAGLQLLLAAHAEGLGGVWTCGPLFAPESVRETLALPKSWEPQAMFFIGTPKATPRPKEMKPFDEIVAFVQESSQP